MTAVRLHVCAAFIAMLVTVSAGCAAKEHYVRGTVVTADSAGVTVRHRTGQVVHASVSPSTIYRWDHQTASGPNLVPGARVMVVLGQPRGPFSAKEIRIFSTPTSTGQRSR